MTPPKADYIAADFFLGKTNPCSHAADPTLSEGNRSIDECIGDNATSETHDFAFDADLLLVVIRPLMNGFRVAQND